MWKPIRVISRSNCKPENEEGESKTGVDDEKESRQSEMV